MNKWIAEFDLEDGDIMPEHMDLEYKGARIDFHCRPLEQEPTTKNNLGVDAVSRADVLDSIAIMCSGEELDVDFAKLLVLQRTIKALPPATPKESTVYPKCDKPKLSTYMKCSNCMASGCDMCVLEPTMWQFDSDVVEEQVLGQK